MHMDRGMRRNESSEPVVAKAAEDASVPAQFLCGARPTICRFCGANVWSVVKRSQPKVAGRFSRLPPTRRTVEANGETAHQCDRGAVKRMYPERE